MSPIRNYALVTAAYWGFTLTDGALRMLVLLHFHRLGYTPLQLAVLFLLYEFFGIVTNLVGGWIGARLGLKITLFAGLALQVVALGMLALLDPGWPMAAAAGYVMGAQALSGIAKDLTKMSSKSAIKTVVPEEARGRLFKWVALLTGSKNALKGIGFFLGGFLLATAGFSGALWIMAGGLGLVLVLSVLSLPAEIGRAKVKQKFSSVFSHSPRINLLSAARFFLFASRDAWFVVGLPIFLTTTLGWGFAEIGAYMAIWVIGYGAVQSIAPRIVGRGGGAPGENQAMRWALILLPIPAAIALAVGTEFFPAAAVLGGLVIFGLVFAINSSLHSYLIVSFAEGDRVAMNVGFYYMANAGGRLAGTLLSGLVYQWKGLEGCLWTSMGLIFASAVLAAFLPRRPPAPESRETEEVQNRAEG